MWLPWASLWTGCGWLKAGMLERFLGDMRSWVCSGPHSMLLRLEVSDSDWWECEPGILLVRSGEEVELTGELPRPVEELTLHRPVLPVPRLPRPLSDLPAPPTLRPPTRLRLPWLPDMS